MHVGHNKINLITWHRGQITCHRHRIHTIHYASRRGRDSVGSVGVIHHCKAYAAMLEVKHVIFFIINAITICSRVTYFSIVEYIYCRVNATTASVATVVICQRCHINACTLQSLGQRRRRTKSRVARKRSILREGCFEIHHSNISLTKPITHISKHRLIVVGHAVSLPCRTQLLIVLHHIACHDDAGTSHLGACRYRLLLLTRSEEKGQKCRYEHQQYGHKILHGIKLRKISSIKERLSNVLVEQPPLFSHRSL